MHTTEEQSWERSDLFEEITIENVEDLRAGGQECTIEIIIRHPHLSEGISSGSVYIQASLPSVLEAIATCLSTVVGDMEARIPETWRRPFPHRCVRSSLHRAGLAFEGLVRDSEER